MLLPYNRAQKKGVWNPTPCARNVASAQAQGSRHLFFVGDFRWPNGPWPGEKTPYFTAKTGHMARHSIWPSAMALVRWRADWVRCVIPSGANSERPLLERGVRPARRPISSLGLLLLSLNAAQGYTGRAADVSILILPRLIESGNCILGVRTELPQRSGRCGSDAGILVLERLAEDRHRFLGIGIHSAEGSRHCLANPGRPVVLEHVQEDRNRLLGVI